MLTIDSNAHGPMGELIRKYVFDKQEGTAAGAVSPAGAPTSGSAPMAAPAATGPKLNFSGNWKLNAAKSDFGEMPAPDSRTEMIEHNQPAIKITTTQTGGPMGEMTFSLDLKTNGNASTTSIMGNDVKSAAHWQGNLLIVDSSMKVEDGDLTFTNTYSLSDDKKTLNLLTRVSGPMGDADMKMTFDKQP